MGAGDFMTWAELEKYCLERQRHCHETLDLKTQNAAQRIETERRTGMAELEAAVNLLTSEVSAIKKLMGGKYLYLLCLGMVGVGASGKEIITLVVKQLI